MRLKRNITLGKRSIIQLAWVGSQEVFSRFGRAPLKFNEHQNEVTRRRYIIVML